MSSTENNKATITVPFKYDWNFDQDSLKKWKNKENIFSPIFGPENLDMFKFQFAFDAYKWLDLILVSSMTPSLKLKYKIIVNQTSNKKPFEFIKDDEFSELYIDEKYCITWDRIFTSVGPFKSINCEFELILPDKQGAHLRSLFTDLNSLRSDSRFTDVTFVVGDREFPANKMILCARSPVFSVMFSRAEFVENQQNRVDITDIDEEVFEALLDFIYTTQVKSLYDIEPELLVAAHKYDIASLVEMCAQSMISNIETENAVNYLLHANMYNLAELKNKTIDFINRNAGEVTKSEDWTNLMKPDNPLMSELYLDLVDKHPKT